MQMLSMSLAAKTAPPSKKTSICSASQHSPCNPIHENEKI
jgi:hypothetical protein